MKCLFELLLYHIQQPTQAIVTVENTPVIDVTRSQLWRNIMPYQVNCVTGVHD